jgi:RNA polymerase sigma-70 factor, ECF subfamily
MRRAWDDTALIDQARRGSTDAAGRLFDRYWTVAWKAAYAVTGDRVLADDAAQEAMQKAFRSLDRFDSARPFAPWLKRIAVNRAIDELRRDRRLRSAEHPRGEAPDAAYGDVSGPLAHVAAAVAQLPADKRTVVVMHYWLDYAAEEIAEALEIPVGTVASRLSRARAELRAWLEQEEEEHVA